MPIRRMKQSEDAVFSAVWRKDGGATVTVKVRGGRYHRNIERDGLATLREAADLLRVNPATVWRWVEGGIMKGLKYQGVIVVGMSELRKYGLASGYLMRGKDGSIIPAE